VGAALASTCTTQGHICCVPEPDKAPKEVANQIITKAIFLKIAGNTIRNNALYRYFTESVTLAGIRTEYQIAAYLAQLIHETDYFRQIESSVLENDENSLLGNSLPGDGTLFRGRGGILLRGRSYYQKAKEDNGEKKCLLSFSALDLNQCLAKYV